MKYKKYTKKLLTVIPGGSHTYSRGADTFPSNAPSILKSGKGVYIFDEKGKKWQRQAQKSVEAAFGCADFQDE